MRAAQRTGRRDARLQFVASATGVVSVGRGGSEGGGGHNISIAKSNIDKCAKWRRVSAAGPRYATHLHPPTCIHTYTRDPGPRARTHARSSICNTAEKAERRVVERGAPLAADRASDPRGNNYRDLCYLCKCDPRGA